MWLNTAAYYDSNYEIINWVPHVLYTLLPGCIDKKQLLSLSFFAENLHFFFFNLNNELKRLHKKSDGKL